jgi:hypothetical protein
MAGAGTPCFTGGKKQQPGMSRGKKVNEKKKNLILTALFPPTKCKIQGEERQRACWLKRTNSYVDR